MFGCWTSVSRKSVLPVFEELNGLLFYPVQYEGEESSRNVFYTGAAPNQQAIPAVEYLMSEDGGGAERFVLLGTDYVYPRTTNKILRAFLNAKGIGDEDIMETYTPFGHSDWQTIVADVKDVRRPGQADGDRLDHQRRRQRAVLQGAGEPGHRRRGSAGGRLLGRRGGAVRYRHLEPGRSPRRLELLHVGRRARERRRSSTSGTRSSRTTRASPTIRWRRTTSASTCGCRRCARPARPTSMPSGRRCTARRCRTSPAASRS